MTALTPTETHRSWHASGRDTPVQLFLAEGQGDAAAIGGMKLAGFGCTLNLVPVDAPLGHEEIGDAPAAVIQVQADNQASVDRFQALAHGNVPVIAALYDPPLVLSPGDRVEVTCEWTNTTDHLVEFPEEMCAAVSYYTPARGFLGCVGENGVPLEVGGSGIGGAGCRLPAGTRFACRRYLPRASSCSPTWTCFASWCARRRAAAG